MATLDPNPSGRRVLSYHEMREALYHRDLVQGTKEFAPGNVTENVVGQLDGEDHKRRRRRENPLFRGAVLETYEDEVLPEVIDELLAPMLAQGGGDAVTFGYEASLVVSARAAGVDFDWRDGSERRELMHLDRKFMNGALLSETKEDLIDQVRREGIEALEDFDRKFFGASRARREALIAAAAEDDSVELPQDLLTSLLVHREELGLDDGTLIRETAYVMESGGNTSVQLLANVLDILLDDSPRATAYRERATNDLGFTQRCVLEVQRLRPQRQTIRRRAGTDTEVAGCPVSEGDLLLLDIPAANTDKEFWGDDAEEFDPERELPVGAFPAGLSFSGGLHTCIGRTLAVGSTEHLRRGGGADESERSLFGLVPRMVYALLQAGVQRDPEHSPSFDGTTYRRRRWASFPVRFAR